MTGEEFKTLRKKLGYTQRQLAAELDMTIVTISGYENDRLKIKKVIELAIKALGYKKRFRNEPFND
jgi:transcriptional regulator with XRE-family HTH domain